MSESSNNEQDGVQSTRRSRLYLRAQINGVPLKTILVTVFVIVVVYFSFQVLYRLRAVILLMLVGAFVALLLNPIVVFLQHWKLPRRGAAVLVVTLAAILVFVGLSVAFGYPLVNSMTHLANALPKYVSNAEHNRGWIGHLLHRYHVETWLQRNSSKLVSLANGLSKPALALGKGAATLLVALVTIFAFVTLLLLEGPKIRRAGLAMMLPKNRVWVSKVGAQVSRAALGYMLGNFLTSLIAGFVVFITLFTLSVPFAILFAIWVALVDFIPQIGGALAGIPTVLFALVHSVTAGVITAIVFVVYSLVENHVLNPIIMSRTVKINPLSVFVAILVGAEIGSWVGGIFGGFVGVLLAVPSAATIHVLFREIWNSTASPPGVVQTISNKTDPFSAE
ncbi:MAG TPA: AI-2E family transporter [Acidimicrobiales bacterium]|nr:AI-2E family transporter [Acidimicrobiales bacterium]